MRRSARHISWTGYWRWLAVAFGFLATLLASIGLYGITAFNVTRRTQEIGIRMALGAARGNVLRLVMREVLVLAAAGLIVGVPAALDFGQAGGEPVIRDQGRAIRRCLPEPRAWCCWCLCWQVIFRRGARRVSTPCRRCAGSEGTGRLVNLPPTKIWYPPWGEVRTARTVKRKAHDFVYPHRRISRFRQL